MWSNIPKPASIHWGRDRGYVSEQLEQRVLESDSQFIIKGRANMASGTILEAYGDNGQALPEYIGKRYATIKERDDQELDVLVRTKTGHQVRLLRKLNPAPTAIVTLKNPGKNAMSACVPASVATA